MSRAVEAQEQPMEHEVGKVQTAHRTSSYAERDGQLYIISATGRREMRGKINQISISWVWLKIREKEL